jgi:hypothetical protein
MKVRVASSPFWLLYSARIGTNAWEKCSLGEDPSQQIGQFEGNKEGVGRHPGAECTGNERVTNKPRTRESIVIELTAANDLSRFIEGICACR